MPEVPDVDPAARRDAAWAAVEAARVELDRLLGVAREASNDADAAERAAAASDPDHPHNVAMAAEAAQLAGE